MKRMQKAPVSSSPTKEDLETKDSKEKYKNINIISQDQQLIKEQSAGQLPDAFLVDICLLFELIKTLVFSIP